MEQTSRIYVAGHSGQVGGELSSELERQGYKAVLTRTRAELDLREAGAVQAFFDEQRPEYVVLAAARVGGILANIEAPAEFIRDNLQIQTNVLEAARLLKVKRLLFLGSSCIYPRLCPQPIREEYLLTGPLEATNRSYALAKIAGVELCWAYNRQYGTRFLAAMPTNLYGPRDHFDPQHSHVLAALLRKVHAAKEAGEAAVMVWGTGTPRREFLFTRDLAAACVHLLTLDEAAYDSLLPSSEPPIVNVGTGEDVTIRELAQLVCRIVGYEGTLQFDPSKPDGTPRKLLDVSRMSRLGWRSSTPLEVGIRQTYEAVRHKL